MELVIYEPSILTKIHQKQQIFNFNGIINKEITIEQEGRGTGGILWPASELLSNYIISSISPFNPTKYLKSENNEQNLNHFWNWEDKKVLELGSGLGLTSIILASLGAKVIATDGEETVVDQLSKNFDLNLNEELRDNVVSCVYRWGDSLQTIFDCLNESYNHNQEHKKEVIEVVEVVETKINSIDKHDWKKTLFSFDVILAADIVYGEDTYVWSLLQQTLQMSSMSLTTLNQHHSNTNLQTQSPTPLILIAQTERYPEKERIFFNQLDEIFNLRDIIDISGEATCSLNDVYTRNNNNDDDNDNNDNYNNHKLKQKKEISNCKLYIYTL